MNTMKALACAVGLGVLAVATPATAQDRTAQSYAREVGIRYATLWEEGGEGFDGDTAMFGLVFDGSFGLFELGGWQGQVVAEYAFHKFGNYFDGGEDITYNQLGGGIRFSNVFTPRFRAYGQFVLGWQNDGFEESNNAVVYQPGGGVNFSLTRMLDAQVQIDFPFADYPLGIFNQFRMGFGVGIPLGR